MRLLFGSRPVWYFSIPGALAVLVVGVVVALVATSHMSSSIEADALNEARRDVEWGAHVVAYHFPPDRLAAPVSGSEYVELDQELQEMVKHPGVRRIKVWSPSGQIIYSDEPSLVGRTFPIAGGLAEALEGNSASETSNLDVEENIYESSFGRLLETYAPIRYADSPAVVGVLEVYEDYGRVAERVESTRRMIYAVGAAGLAMVYAILFVVHRWGTAIIGRQRDELLRQQAELVRRSDELRQSYDETLHALAAALDQRDHATEDHGRRVSELATAVARELCLDDSDVEHIGRAAIVHDIGKMMLPDAILSKPGPLTDEEWHLMRKHPGLGYEMLKHIPVLREAAKIIYAHHERYDGKGYPRGLTGDEIPIGSRIFSVVDTYDAITSDRPYRRAASHREAMEEIARCADSQFDPEVVQAFREVEKIGLVGTWRSGGEADAARPQPPKAGAGVPSA